MHFIRIIQAATKSTARTKKLTKKPSKKLPKVDKNTKKFTQNAPRKTLTKKPNKSITVKNKGIYPLQDVSTSVLKDLLEQGYNMVTFVAHSNACTYCKGINGKTKPLAQHLKSLRYDAPLFEISHVNSLSELKIWDKNGELPDVFVNYNGDIHE